MWLGYVEGMWQFTAWKENLSADEKGCLQELCNASNAVWKLSMVPEEKRDE